MVYLSLHHWKYLKGYKKESSFRVTAKKKKEYSQCEVLPHIDYLILFIPLKF
jgi:hypothetical protein